MNSVARMVCIRKNRGIKVALFTGLIFFLQLSFWNQAPFGADEVEIFVKGQQMANGEKLFVDVVTQHMPIMYHFAALFSKLGIETIAGFRAAFYFLFACLWGVAYWRFGLTLGEKAVALSPIVYLVIISGIPSSTCILSDQIQAIGMAYILFELLQFYKTKKICFVDCLMMSAGVFISFFSAFVSVFSLFAAATFMLSIEVRDGIQANRNFANEIKYLARKYSVLIITVALPPLFLLICYDRADMLGSFVKWAYSFNREVYPKYYPGGYGNSVLYAMFGGIGNLASSLNLSSGQLSTSFLVNVLFLLSVLLCLVESYVNYRDIVFVIGMSLFVVTCATRGVLMYHGLAAISVLSIFCAMYLCEHVPNVWGKSPTSGLRRPFLIFAGLFLSSNYLSKLPEALSFTTKEYSQTNSNAHALGAITKKGEKVGFVSTDYMILLSAGVTPASFGCSDFPWYWEWCGEQELAELSQNMPRVFYYAPDPWGFTSFTSYAAGIAQLVNENYSNLSAFGYPNVYVLKKILQQSG